MGFIMTKHNHINQDEVEDFVKKWKDGVIEIGTAYQENNNFKVKLLVYYKIFINKP